MMTLLLLLFIFSSKASFESIYQSDLYTMHLFLKSVKKFCKSYEALPIIMFDKYNEDTNHHHVIFADDSTKKCMSFLSICRSDEMTQKSLYVYKNETLYLYLRKEQKKGNNVYKTPTYEDSLCSGNHFLSCIVNKRFNPQKVKRYLLLNNEMTANDLFYISPYGKMLFICYTHLGMKNLYLRFSSRGEIKTISFKLTDSIMCPKAWLLK